ncbi:MAG TPA: pilus assembly protein PilM [Solirubrobacteraceae bacterium]|jgi:type IV pilus assembly protein PilM|nr:pilus assembly protein PilM [Solirubrobacteraceae bacterium]
MKLPSNLSSPNLKLGLPSTKLKLSAPSFKAPSLGRRAGADVVGLDIQPGFVAAVKARANGSIVAERAISVPLAADVMRDGEVLDEAALTSALRELFADAKLGKRVRIGVANQRTVLRTLELPPVTDQKELAAAVSFQAQDQVPMPLGNAVLDFHPLGIVETPSGPRQRVVLVAAQRDMVERLLNAVRGAGLTAAGVDLSAFALIRSLYRHEADQTGRVLYLNVDGLSNLAIAEGTVCRFTRVVGSGLEGMAVELAERRGIALVDARARLLEADLTTPPLPEPRAAEAVAEEAPAVEPESESDGEAALLSPAEAEAREREMSFEELSAVGALQDQEPGETPAASDADVWTVLDNGVREISGEVRNSLDFHRSQDGGGEVSHVVLSGAAQDIPGFAEALQGSLGVEVRPTTIGITEGGLEGDVSTHRLAVAAGLAASEIHQ